MSQEIVVINYPDTATEKEPTTYTCPLCCGVNKTATEDDCVCCGDYGRVICIPYKQ